MIKHEFVICAYKESKYLEDCIISLKKQKKKSNIKLATSTPNNYIENLCNKYQIEMFVNKGEKGIAGDWNFAYSCSDAQYITIAHQDDIYRENYSTEIINTFDKYPHALIAFSDYSELINGNFSDNGFNLKLKRIMLKNLRNHDKAYRIKNKRSAIRLGNAICCPSVTYSKEALCDYEPLFKTGFRSNVDWETWERISRAEGEFLYCNEILMAHRIHEESETSAVIGDNLRSKEDYEMFLKFWNRPIAKVLTKIYSLSEKENNV